MQIIRNPNDLISSIAGFPAAMDAVRRTEVQRLAAANETERGALEVERKRLATKYGTQSAQATAAAARLDYLDKARAVLATEVQREMIPVPELSAKDFVVYGRILDPVGSGVQGADVTAVSSGARSVANTTSIEQGVFELHVPLAQLSDEKASIEPTFQLEVRATKIAAPFRSDEIFHAAGGRMMYRDIILSQSMTTQPPPAPPPAQRSAEMPHRASRTQRRRR
jgi:hypothetical protein